MRATGQAKEFWNLAADDNQPHATEIAADDWERDEFYEPAHTEQTETDLDTPGKQGDHAKQQQHCFC